MKPVFSCLTAALLLMATRPASRACQYCQMAAAGDPEAARLAAQIHGQGFPLEGIINQYAPVAPSANLTAPPTAASVATKASDLPTTVIRRATPPPLAAKPAPAPRVDKAPPLPAAAAGSAHWADAGLLGLLAAGGLFCWRTRRPTTVPLS